MQIVNGKLTSLLSSSSYQQTSHLHCVCEYIATPILWVLVKNASWIDLTANSSWLNWPHSWFILAESSSPYGWIGPQSPTIIFFTFLTYGWMFRTFVLSPSGPSKNTEYYKIYLKFVNFLIINLLKGMEHVPNILMSFDKYLFLEVINILI